MNDFQVGDIVTPTRSSAWALDSFDPSPSDYIVGREYEVVKVRVNSIETRCLLTGIYNGWSKKYFTLVETDVDLKDWL